MTSTLPLQDLIRPTVIEVWSPSCAPCRAMRPDLEAVAREHTGTVDLVLVDASQDAESAAALRVMGTPTLIVVRDGVELFRITGRRSRDELTSLFAAAVGDGMAPPARGDIAIRVAAGVALIGLGAVSGPVWPLVGLGILVASWAVLHVVRRRK